MYNVIDLFAGAGGLSLGFQQTQKYCIKVAFENNPTMQETYKKNFPGVEVQGDVCKADYDKINKQYGPIDVVIGGPPCQGFSNANRQKNHMISHNNSLVKEYIRAILQLKPRAFVMENVSMLRSDVHRFFLSKEDEHLVNDSRLEMKVTIIPLLDRQFLFDQRKPPAVPVVPKSFSFAQLNIRAKRGLLTSNLLNCCKLSLNRKLLF